MSRNVLIGIDAGTSVIKAVAFDLEGQQIAAASRRNHYESVPGGGVEQDMVRTWKDTQSVIAEVAEKVGPDNVLCIGVTGQGDGTWLIDGDGVPVHDGWLWLDARAATEAREIAESPSIELIYRLTGTGVNVCQMRTHLLWMMRNAPELLDRASTAFHCKDWLFYQLTGVRATDPTEGVFTFGDMRTRDYSEPVLEALGLSHLEHLLPTILDGAAESRPLSRNAAEATGLPEGLPVSLGYVDIMCSALGAGLHDEESMPGLTVLGSTGMHMRFAASVEEVKFNDAFSGYTMAFPGKAFAQMQTNMAATLNIDWLLGIGAELMSAKGAAIDPGDLLIGLDEQVLDARPGAAMYHPYISSSGERGPFANPNARASFTGLDQQAGWFDLTRAVFDGLALASRDCYSAMGPIPHEVRITGGAARSAAMLKILASALNAPVRGVAQSEAGAAGVAMMAGIAEGVFADAPSATKAWVTPLLESPIAPEASLIPVYDALFQGYLETRLALDPVWEAQAAMRRALP